jgi:hypothetical protein
MVSRAVKSQKVKTLVMLALAKPLPRVPDVISRREMLIVTAVALLSGRVSANSGQLKEVGHAALNWSEFQAQMTALAVAEANGSIDQKTVAELGMQYLKELDIHSAEFMDAVDASYESGNSYWLWQRMIKERNINGGILNIDSDRLVQLHDHPGATGVLRIISGEMEVWQYDQLKQGSEENKTGEQRIVELELVSHKVMRAGDMAVLTPTNGNIHALRSISRECRMLDFFIPPYERHQRNWFEPIAKEWFNEPRIACKKISQHEYTMA